MSEEKQPNNSKPRAGLVFKQSEPKNQQAAKQSQIQQLKSKIRTNIEFAAPKKRKRQQQDADTSQQKPDEQAESTETIEEIAKATDNQQIETLLDETFHQQDIIGTHEQEYSNYELDSRWEKLAFLRKKTVVISIIGLGVLAIIGFGATQFLGTGSGDNDGVLGVDNERSLSGLNAYAPNDPDIAGYDLDREANILRFKEKLSGKNVYVSQQRIPDDLQNGVTSLEAIAQTVNPASGVTKLATSKGLAYMNKTVDNEQRVNFMSDDLLVGLSIEGEVANADIVSYINDLQIKITVPVEN